MTEQQVFERILRRAGIEFESILFRGGQWLMTPSPGGRDTHVVFTFNGDGALVSVGSDTPTVTKDEVE